MSLAGTAEADDSDGDALYEPEVAFALSRYTLLSFISFADRFSRNWLEIKHSGAR